MDNKMRNIEEKKFFEAKSSFEKIRFLLNYAIFAPSTHNSQPWLFKIKEESCEIYKDANLCLPQADPLNRDLYISIGCAIENLILAARYFGVYKDIRYYFNNNLIAEVFFCNLEEARKPNPELENFIVGIKSRVNARGIFEDKKIPEETVKEIINLNDFKDIRVDILTEKTKIEEIAKLIAKGLEIAYQKKEFREEMSRWVNNSLSRRKEGIPGYALKMPLLISFIFPFLIRKFDIGKKLAQLNYLSVKSFSASLLISSKESSPQIWVKVGQLAERIMVYLAGKKIKSSVFVSAIEMGLSEDLKKIFNISTEPQFHFCIGYSESKTKFTLRHSVNEKLIG
jgi:hypothetical protein